MQHFSGVLMVLCALIVSLVVFFVSKTAKKDNKSQLPIEEEAQPQTGQLNTLYEDEIIAVRKVERASEIKENSERAVSTTVGTNRAVYVLHVMAKDEELFKGYELLQALLSQGLRFGEMSIFHRHQQLNGKGAVLFSLTSAVEPGTFDIHKMGRCICPGLTLFMASSGNSANDIERFDLMVSTAQSIARELGGICQDKNRQVLNDELIKEYQHKIYKANEIDEPSELSGIA